MLLIYYAIQNAKLRFGKQFLSHIISETKMFSEMNQLFRASKFKIGNDVQESRTRTDFVVVMMNQSNSPGLASRH